MVEIEFEPPQELEPCGCCGFPSAVLTRFVLEDGDLHAVCYVLLSEGHLDRTARAVVSIGPWGSGASPSDRTAFSLDLRSRDKNFAAFVRDAGESPWRNIDLLGRMLDRDEALQHPLCAEAFGIADRLFAQDELLRDYLFLQSAA